MQTSILARHPISCASTFDGIFLTSISMTNLLFYRYKHVFSHKMFQFYKSFHPHKKRVIDSASKLDLFCVRARLSIV